MGHLLKAAVRSWFSVVAISFCASEVIAQKIEPETYQVGVAQIDITPDYAIRLSGFGFRRTESEGVTQRIWAKALAVEDQSGKPVVVLKGGATEASGRAALAHTGRLAGEPSC